MIDLDKFFPKQNRIKSLYANNKGYDWEYIEYLVDNKLDILVMAFEKAKTREEYISLVKELLKSNRISYLTKNIINYETYEVLFNDDEFVTSALALKYLNASISKEDSKKIFGLYKDALYYYINDNNFVKNSFNNYDGSIEYVLADFTKPFTMKDLTGYYDSLFIYNIGNSII